MTIKMAYFFVPLVLAFFIKSLESDKFKSPIITGILFALCIAYEIRISYILLGILFFYSIYTILLSRNQVSELFIHIKIFSLFLITTLLLGGYWILPYFSGVFKSQISSILPSTPWISWMKLIDAITLRHSFYTLNGEIRTFIVHEINQIFFLIPIISFSALFLKNKNKNIIFFALLSVIGIFLVKQENIPFHFIYTWLFQNFPGFNMFREASKFYLIVALGYSVLFGVTVAEIYKRIKKVNIIFMGESHQFNLLGKHISIFFVLLILVTQLIMASPITSGKQKNETYYPINEIPYEYREIERFIKKQPPNEFSTLWIPYMSRFSFYSDEYPIITPEGSEFLERLLIQYYQVTKFRTKHLGSIISLIGLDIKYIVLTPDLPLWEEKLGETIYNGNYARGVSVDKYKQFLEDQEDLERIELGENIYIYENKKYEKSFFEVKPVNFNLNKISSYRIENIILNSNFEDKNIGEWSINAVNVHNIFLSSEAYEGKCSLKTEVYNSTSGWKVIKSPLIPIKYGDLSRFQFYIKGENSYAVHKKLTEYDENRTIINSYYDGSIGEGNFDWKKVSTEFAVVSSETAYIQLQIWYGHETTEPLPNNLWVDSIKVYVHALLDPGAIYPHLTQDNELTIMNYYKINPTKYIVNINTSKPCLLTLGENYNPLWTANINGTKIRSTLLYPMINSFQINTTGVLKITIEYEPQRWFYYGSAVSVSTLIASLAYLIWDRKKEVINDD